MIEEDDKLLLSSMHDTINVVTTKLLPAIKKHNENDEFNSDKDGFDFLEVIFFHLFVDRFKVFLF